MFSNNTKKLIAALLITSWIWADIGRAQTNRVATDQTHMNSLKT